MSPLAKRLVWATSLFVVVWCNPAAVAQQPVQYEVTFDASWSAATHPTAYPPAAHFSPLVGATHNDQVILWESGGIATPGIESMAETGSVRALLSEIQTAQETGTADATIGGQGINAPGKTTLRFEVTPTHSVVTLVTMIAPSPDWFVGVSSLGLRNKDGWIDEKIIALHGYDAGTDSGRDFRSPNMDTNPQELITLLGAPLAGTPPLGTFTFTRLPVFLDRDFNNNGVLDAGDIDGLSQLICDGLFDPKMDLNDDNALDEEDHRIWIDWTFVGDANLNGEFNSEDLVDVFTAAEYEDDIEDNSTFGEGDWNGDKDFDTSDFVDAFVDGGYELGPKPAVAAVPEPTPYLLLMTGLIGIAMRRRYR